MSEIPTKHKILDAAEKLYADKGFAATSLREIIKSAGVNTAAVHYHFGSKVALVQAVLLRRAAPLNSERLRRLDALETEHPTGPLPLEAVLEAFLIPAIRFRFKDAHAGAVFPRLMGRAISETDEHIGEIIHEIFHEAFRRFTAAFKRALPGLSEEDVRWRMHFMIGAMAFTLVFPQHPHVGEGVDPAKLDQLTERLTSFIAAGMRGGIAVGKDQP